MAVKELSVLQNPVTLINTPASADVGFWHGWSALPDPTMTRESVPQERGDFGYPQYEWEQDWRNWRKLMWSSSDVRASGVTYLEVGCGPMLLSGSLQPSDDQEVQEPIVANLQQAWPPERLARMLDFVSRPALRPDVPLSFEPDDYPLS